MTPKQLRALLYARQCKLMRRQDGNESVCLPGELVRLNPGLLLGKRQRAIPANDRTMVRLKT